MKKIIGVFAVTAIAVIMFFSANNVDQLSSDKNLSDVIAMNSANAEWVFFGCGMGGDYCGGVSGCKSVIVSSNRCN